MCSQNIYKKNTENTGVAVVMNTGPAKGQSQKPQRRQGRRLLQFFGEKGVSMQCRRP
jgi:hypothetical protein